jgi:hypothetical protein
MDSPNREAALEALRDVARNASDDQHRIEAAHSLLVADERYTDLPGPLELADRIAERVVRRLKGTVVPVPPIE